MHLRQWTRHQAGKGTKNSKPPQTFWVSWDDYSGVSPDERGSKIISAWVSGYAGDGEYSTIVAWVIASRLEEVIAVVDKAYPSVDDRRWRFILPREANWRPGDGFAYTKRAEAKLKKLKEGEQ